MNKAQLMTSLGESCFEWRTDLLPARSVLALELQRQPTFRAGMTNREYRLTPAERTVRIDRLDAARCEPTTALGVTQKKLLNVLRLATRNGQRLSYSEICERAGLQPSGSTHRVLGQLFKLNLVEREGQNRGAVYWAEEAEHVGEA